MSEAHSQGVVSEAVRWLAIMNSGSVTSSQATAFMAWRDASDEHARCMDELVSRLGAIRDSPLSKLSSQQISRSLNAPSSRRQFINGMFAITACAVSAAILSRVGSTGFAWPGDLYTGIGERESYDLADGSRVTLNSATRVSPSVTQRERSLAVHRGELILDVRPGHTPFLINAAGWQLSANQKRLLVRCERDGGYLVALDGDLELKNGQARVRVAQGRWARFNDAGELRTGVAAADETLWLKGLLEVNSLPLVDVIERIRPYRRGVIQLSADVANVPISGILPLDNTDHALAMLSRIAPIKVTSVWDVWVKIDAA
ncbi:FecR family protein [Pseudomonas rustica]